MTRARGFGQAAWLLLTALSLLGCEDDLAKASLIAHMRVLGARTEVIGDEARSTPRPGERARLSWAVAFRDYGVSEEELSSLFVVCTAPSRFTGNPVCQEIVDAITGSRPSGFGLGSMPAGCDVKPDSEQTLTAGLRLYCVSGTPELELKIDRTVKTDRLIQGIVCRNGIPRFDLDSPVGVTCSPKSGVKARDVESIAVYGTVAVEQKANDANRNPDLSRLRVALRATPSARARAWNPTPSEALPELIEDCSGANRDVLPSSNGYPAIIELDYPAAERTEDEDLVFSTYATLGDLSRRFTVYESDTGRDPDEPDQIWELSEDERDELLGDPTLVRFYFTVLDGRGGFDMTTRELCINRL